MEPLPDTSNSPETIPGRGILSKMALAGLTLAGVTGALGVASIASADSPLPEEPAPAPAVEQLPVEIPMSEGESLTIQDLTDEVKTMLGIEEHGDMENWDDCPACGMG